MNSRIARGSTNTRKPCYVVFMDPNISALERAFSLAKSGKFDTVVGIKRQLQAEGYSANQISGPSLLKQLRGLIEAAKSPPADRSQPDA